MVCHGLPQEVWTYDGSRWTKKATLATSGNATSKAEWGSEMNVQMMDFMKPPGTTRGQHGHVADGFRTTVQLIQYVILPVLRLSNILRCRKETKLSPSTYMIYMYIYMYTRFFFIMAAFHFSSTMDFLCQRFQLHLALRF